jgi:long-chain acyl-CoA synthetase
MAEHSGLFEYIDLMERWGERAYLVGSHGYRTRKWTFSEARDTILGMSGVLAERNIRKGDKVIFLGPSSPEWVFAFFAVLHRGAVVVPADPHAPEELILKIFEKTQPSLCMGEYPPVGKKCQVIPFSSVRDFRNHPPGYPEEITQDDHAEIVFTSGTTGNPKGVVLTHGNILSNLKPMEDGVEKHMWLVRILTPFRLLCTVPFSHMFGQIAGIFLPILIGSTIYFRHDNDPACLVRAIKRNRILTLITVPRIMKLLKDHFFSNLQSQGRTQSFKRRWDRWVNLPYPLRVPFYFDIHRFFGLHFWSFIVGGAPLDPDTHEFWRRLVFAVFQGYGLTETAPMVTLFNPFKDNRNSVGRIFPNQEVRVLSDGEIIVRGKNVMAGYYQDPEETSRVLEDGWFRTGDIGSIAPDGQVFIKGRKKEMILTSDGHNVFPEDIDEILNRIEGVREGFVYGVPAHGGETVHAVLLLHEWADPDKVVRIANKRLLPYQRIRGYSVWEDADFPRTPTLKVRKAEVIKKIAKKNVAIPKKNVLQGLVAGPVKPDARLIEDLGLDSLDRVEAVIRLEREYGMSLDETVIGPGTTLRDLTELAQKPQVKMQLKMPRWTKWLMVRVLRRIVMNGCILQLMKLYCPVQCHGIQSLEKTEGARILACNHTSHLDPVAILLALPFQYRKRVSPAMGLNRFWAHFDRFSSVDKGSAPKMRRFLHGMAYNIVTFLFQTYPFPQGAAYRPSLEYTGELLDRGHWILIFPEGEVSPDGAVQQFRKGIAMLAEQTDTPVFPLCISGMEKVLPPGKRWPKRASVTVSFGDALYYKGQGYEKFTEEIENRVKKLHVHRI